MAYAAVTFLLNNVKYLLSYHTHLISDDAKKELEQLGKELDDIEGSLNKASLTLNKNRLFIEWERQVKEVVYELEDTIDLFITRSAAAKNTSSFLRSLYMTMHISLAKDVKLLREQRLIPLIQNGKIAIASLPPIDEEAFDTSTDEARSESKKVPRQDNVVGFEDETDKIIGYLLEESEELEIISITGIPGLGKTTLAWKIYCNPKIRNEIPILIWIYLSQNFNMKDVLITILKKFNTKQDMSDKSVEELEPLVREYLKKTRIFMFIDDVWTVDAWNQIQTILPKHNKMVKVLITSRSDSVAWHANSKRDPHRLRFLTLQESWELLQLEVFGELDRFPPDLEEIGKYIASRCDGLPSAIIVIGGILADTISTTGDIERKWKKVSQNMRTYLNEGISMENFISWSYFNLPNDLRDCFLYLGVFSDDAEISVWELTKLWIAEGFIKQKPNGKSLEETAHDNLKVLIDNNLVMVDKMNLSGEVKTCRMHRSIAEICRKEAAIGKQNLFHEVRKSNEGVLEQEIEKYRRLCIHSYVRGFLSEKPKVPHARSFLCFSEPIDLNDKDIPSIIDAFELLRVFEVKSIKFPKFPIKITDLVHLRYLTLSVSGDEFNILPKAMSNLWNLQTLTVDTMSSTLEIKANIWHMMQLRHVKTKASIILNCKDVKGDGGGNLQTLSKLSPQSCTLDVFEKAKNLNTLGIRGELDKLEDSKCLESLDLLEKLKLVNHVVLNVASENPLGRLPCTFPKNLKFLTLSNTYLNWSHMSSTVGNIPNLEMLKLKGDAFVGNSWDVVHGGFHRLKFLYIFCSDLRVWTATGDSFPRLRSLVLENCVQLESVPIELGKNLEMLSIQLVNKSVVASAKKIQLQKQQMELGQQRTKRGGGFKLIIAPGDEF